MQHKRTATEQSTNSPAVEQSRGDIAQSSGKPTLDMYQFIQTAFDFFNDKLFGGTLSQILINLPRDKKICGYFSYQRWIKDDGETYVHEIALNPDFFHTRPLEFFQTIVHEMVHQRQYEQGTPSKGGYHNSEWASKMESIGLMPSSTGQPGGKKTGYKVSDYPIENSAFSRACIQFARQGFKIPFFDIYGDKPSEFVRQSSDATATQIVSADVMQEIFSEELPVAPDVSDLGEEVVESLLTDNFSDTFSVQTQAAITAYDEKKKRKTTFVCPECDDKAWGKPTLVLVCGKCNVSMETSE